MLLLAVPIMALSEDNKVRPRPSQPPSVRGGAQKVPRDAQDRLNAATAVIKVGPQSSDFARPKRSSPPALPCPQSVVHWSWLPIVLAVGFSQSNPRPNLIRCVRFSAT